MEENVKDRLLLFLKNKRINNSEFGRMFDVSTAYVSSIRKSISPEMLDKLRSRFPELSIEWLLTGDGQMINNTIQRKSDSDELYYTYLLPMSAVAGTLTEFEGSATLADCEKIVSPIAGVDFAINIYGDSMMPEYPSGSMVLIKRMNQTLRELMPSVTTYWARHSWATVAAFLEIPEQGTQPRPSILNGICVKWMQPTGE